MLTSTDIKSALLKHYAPPGWRMFFEVGNDTGARVKRHIDAMAVGIWPSVGYGIHGIEIKVSRSDWKREMADPAKSQELMRFCNRWWLACPAELKIDPLEVPDTWGILLVHDGGRVTAKRQAPALSPETITPGFLAAVLRQVHAIDDDLITRLVNDQVAESRKSIEAEIERRAASMSQSRSYALEEAKALRETINALTGDDISNWARMVDKTAFAATYHLVKDFALMQDFVRGYGGMAGVANGLRSALSEIERLHNSEGLAAVRAIVSPKKDA